MSTELHFGRDSQGYDSSGPQFPQDMWQATLQGGFETNITVPSNNAAWILYVRVQTNGWVWCARNSTAELPPDFPPGEILLPTNSELIVGPIEYRRVVFAGDTISFITGNSTCDISVALQSTPSP